MGTAGARRTRDGRARNCRRALDDPHPRTAARGFGVFGGGYGALQAAITGATWLPSGPSVVGLLVSVALLKALASALTIGTGAAAGDFAPSLVVGGLVGSAFGHAARLVLGDPTIHPGAFALVGMGTFYGGLAHAPLSALVLVAELAGSYDLLAGSPRNSPPWQMPPGLPSWRRWRGAVAVSVWWW
ncbi:MAG TPA: chloride channel protein [Anaeromyxobacteraceae bacterium]|nr:chloride channel protein [Anaeromyxobacteraceae bacterium]